MIALAPEKARKMIPRWRDSKTTAAMGELGASNRPLEQNFGGDAVLHEKLLDWREHRSISFAADLVGAAIVMNRKDLAKDAAEFILGLGESASEATKRLAQAVYSPIKIQTTTPGVVTPEVVNSEIGRLRRLTRVLPRNPLAWCDMAHLYATRGLFGQADRAMSVALGQAPMSRFVLRCASRLFILEGDPERALHLLRAAPVTAKDSWLMAAEIAISEVAERKPRFAKAGEALIAHAGLPPFHLAELAGALGSLDFDYGKTRAALKMFRLAIKEPTENSIAQAVWTHREQRLTALEIPISDVRRSCEAQAINYRYQSKWREAVNASWQWLWDEPFSARAAEYGSFIAAVALDDYNESLRIIEAGLNANPTHWLLLNNKVFSLASCGRVDEAEATLKSIIVPKDNEHAEGTISATMGLLSFRRGRTEEGRNWYNRAIEGFRDSKHRRNKVLATLFLAREEKLAKTVEWKKEVARAKKMVGDFRLPELEAVLANIEKMK